MDDQLRECGISLIVSDSNKNGFSLDKGFPPDFSLEMHAGNKYYQMPRLECELAIDNKEGLFRYEAGRSQGNSLYVEREALYRLSMGRTWAEYPALGLIEHCGLILTTITRPIGLLIKQLIRLS